MTEVIFSLVFFWWYSWSFFLVSSQDDTMSKGLSCSKTLMDRIKQSLIAMDLMTQMDQAKELTKFALTHEAIAGEDKE
jgi:hypothetical protein